MQTLSNPAANPLANFYVLAKPDVSMMTPRFRKGSQLVIDPASPMQVGREVLVYRSGLSPIVRTLAAFDADTLTLDTCSPVGPEIVRRQDVIAVHLVAMELCIKRVACEAGRVELQAA